jgi:hypothetical protein
MALLVYGATATVSGIVYSRHSALTLKEQLLKVGDDLLKALKSVESLLEARKVDVAVYTLGEKVALLFSLTMLSYTGVVTVSLPARLPLSAWDSRGGSGCICLWNLNPCTCWHPRIGTWLTMSVLHLRRPPFPCLHAHTRFIRSLLKSLKQRLVLLCL